MPLVFGEPARYTPPVAAREDAMEKEPVRLSVHTAALFVALGAFFAAWGNGVDWRLAIAAGFGAFTPVAFAAELARSKAWAPDSVDRLRDQFVAGLEAAHEDP